MNRMKPFYEDVIPSLIGRTTMRRVFFDGVHKSFEIKPNEGYKLHVKGRDVSEIDPLTGKEIHELGYTVGVVTCSSNYDFEKNPQEFYAVIE